MLGGYKDICSMFELGGGGGRCNLTELNCHLYQEFFGIKYSLNHAHSEPTNNEEMLRHDYRHD